jgi:transcriptional regulator with PAS, ATPase and Fis domain
MGKESEENGESVGSIVFTIKNDKAHNKYVEFDMRTSDSFKEKLSGLCSPSVCVIDAAHLKTLLSGELKGDIVDRGKKDAHQPLTRYFCGQKRTPVLEAEYSSAGKVKHGVESFLRKAVVEDSCESSQASVLGIPGTIFAELVKQTGQRVNKKTRVREPSTLLSRLKADQKEPEELAKAFMGRSEDAQLVRQLILRAAKVDEAVLILGDSGTGKEVVARQIHRYSTRSQKKELLVVNCAAISPLLLEMELFGCEQGVIDSRHPGKIGLWEQAHGSTMFLDEIGDLLIDHQAKILRALQEGRFRRIGGEKDIRVDVRIISATNRDVFSMTQSDDFREDLYYRLRGFVIRTSPLRKHPEDIPLLAQAFWKETTKGKAKNLLPEIFDKLKAYSWPGNARDLKLVLSSLRTLYPKKADNGELRVSHLEDAFRLLGHVDGIQDKTPSGSAPPVWRVESLRHLTRVFDVLYAIKLDVHPFVQRKRGLQDTLEDLQTALELRRQELEIFCKNDKLFNRKPIFLEVFNMLGLLMTFQTEIHEDPDKARRNWDLELSEKLHQVISIVSEEIKRVRDKA